jgi:2-polyprenyl-6-methoxyphenol hydroxylase-like FAD-dependent oxidoreductase
VKTQSGRVYKSPARRQRAPSSKFHTLPMAEKTTPRKILISGGGVAGPALAYWLCRSPYLSNLDITIVERSPSPRTTGQAIDLRGPGVKVLQLLGLEAEVRRRTMPEKGTVRHESQ